MLQQMLDTERLAETTLLRDPRNQQSVSILFIAICPMAFAFFGADVPKMVMHGCFLVGFVVALFWISIGLRLRKTYDAKEVTLGSKMPFLTLGSVMLGAVLAGLVVARGGEMPYAVAQGVLATVLGFCTFGFDGFREKKPKTAEEIRAHNAEALKKRSETQIMQMRLRLAELNDSELGELVDTLGRVVGLMGQALIDDTDRYRELNKYLGHYLDEIANVNDRFVMEYRSTADQEMRAEFVAFVQDMVTSFEQELRKFAMGGRDSLAVQVSALRTRIGEGG